MDLHEVNCQIEKFKIFIDFEWDRKELFYYYIA